ncbi:MAG: hypothetical protein ACREA9_12415 [Pyrinomonadaceae bacterium]
MNHKPVKLAELERVRLSLGELVPLEDYMRIAESYRRLVEAGRKDCPSHHLPLVNGWAHRTSAGKTHRCRLSEAVRAALPEEKP